MHGRAGCPRARARILGKMGHISVLVKGSERAVWIANSANSGHNTLRRAMPAPTYRWT